VGHEAIVIQPDNVQELENILLQLILDENFKQKLSENAKEFARRFSRRMIARKHLKFYELICNSKR
jgi:glycosyltransferase involved in cell wall biosynthesis